MLQRRPYQQKEDFVRALRAHQVAIDAAKSEQREVAAWMENAANVILHSSQHREIDNLCPLSKKHYVIHYHTTTDHWMSQKNIEYRLSELLVNIIIPS